MKEVKKHFKEWNSNSASEHARNMVLVFKWMFLGIGNHLIIFRHLRLTWRSRTDCTGCRRPRTTSKSGIVTWETPASNQARGLDLVSNPFFCEPTHKTGTENGFRQEGYYDTWQYYDILGCFCCPRFCPKWMLDPESTSKTGPENGLRQEGYPLYGTWQ